MKTFRIATATLLISSLASIALADDTKKKTEADDSKKKTEVADSKKKTEVADVKKKADSKGEKPKASPGWVVIEEDWSYPFLSYFSDALHDAREHYRSREEKSAAAEIDKAISWLKYAQDHATKATAEELSTAQYDLADFSASLKSGKPVLARKLDASFAHASLALAKHHHFLSAKAADKADLKEAGRHLMVATDLLRNAAQSANLEYGTKVVDIDDDYAPYGYWDDTIVFEKSKLETNLATVQAELEKLAAKLKTGK